MGIICSDVTVCVLTAGMGTRLGEIGRTLNKALLPINNRAAISLILEKFPKSSHFIVALGYKGDQVRDFLKCAHPDYQISFVKVDKYSGEGSGPGYSLLKCKNKLKSNFFFVSCDTLFSDFFSIQDTDCDWFGVSPTSDLEKHNFCNFRVDSNNTIVDILDKKRLPPGEWVSFAGLCHIKNYDVFWKSLESSQAQTGELQISDGIKGLLNTGLAKTRKVNWTDIGTKNKYQAEKSKYEGFDYSKPDEFLFFENNKVIKFFKNSEVVDKKIERSLFLKDILPKCIRVSKNFYCYEYIEGKTFYQQACANYFLKLFEYLNDHLWSKDITQFNINLESDVIEFYRNKTVARIKLYLDTIQGVESESTVLGKKVLSIFQLLQKISWENLFKYIPSAYHGDLQFDNIIFNSSKNKFTLIDWRQEFGSSIHVGDRYYDLAKLYGGIIINYDLIKQNKFSYLEKDGNISFSFAQHKEMPEIKKVFEEILINSKYDLKKIKIITALIYVNMSPLHKAPYSHLLFNFGKYLLQEELE